MRLNRPSIVAALVALLAIYPAPAQLAPTPAEPGHNHGGAEPAGRVILLPRDLELRYAVNALPPSLRDGAGILVLEPAGYVKAKERTNPFTCIVSRRGGNLYPVCFDEEGTRTILPAYMDDATMRMKGASDEEVDRQQAAGFASGLYRPPTRPGIAYMLSPGTYLMQGGKLTRSVPHTMFYAPFLTDADIGGSMGKTAFVDRPGPHGMIIVAAGQAEREKLNASAKDLLDEVDRQIALGQAPAK